VSHYITESTDTFTQRYVERDARVRGWRSFVQGLLIDVTVAATVFLLTVISDLEWTRVYWIMVGLGLAKSVVQGIVSYLARKLVKPANVS
jgi:hypothetical protein